MILNPIQERRDFFCHCKNSLSPPKKSAIALASWFPNKSESEPMFCKCLFNKLEIQTMTKKRQFGTKTRGMFGTKIWLLLCLTKFKVHTIKKYQLVLPNRLVEVACEKNISFMQPHFSCVFVFARECGEFAE